MSSEPSDSGLLSLDYFRKLNVASSNNNEFDDDVLFYYTYGHIHLIHTYIDRKSATRLASSCSSMLVSATRGLGPGASSVVSAVPTVHFSDLRYCPWNLLEPVLQLWGAQHPKYSDNYGDNNNNNTFYLEVPSMTQVCTTVKSISSKLQGSQLSSLPTPSPSASSHPCSSF